MANPAKVETVAELKGIFQKAKSAVLANYQGIDALAITKLRCHMRERSVEFRVIKNTLARQAAKGTPFEVLDGDFKGPISLVVSFEDIVAPVKALAEYARTDAKKSPEIISGLVEGKKVSPQEVKALADLPPKEVLLSQILSTFNGPTTSFVGVFHSMLRELVGTLDAIRVKKSEG